MSRRLLSVVLGATLLAGCSEHGGETVLQNLDLEARFTYRGQSFVDRLPFECIELRSWAAYLETRPSYQVSVMPDGSLLVFNFIGLCEAIGGDKSGRLRPGDGLYRNLEAPKTVLPPFARWMSSARKPRTVDFYLTNTSTREDLGHYLPQTFRVVPLLKPWNDPDARKRAQARRHVWAWDSELTSLPDYCGGAIVERQSDGKANDAPTPPNNWLRPDGLPRILLVLPGTSYDPSLYQEARKLSRPVTFENGKWSVFDGESHVLRVYRNDTVKIDSKFEFDGKEYPFQHTGNADVSADGNLSIHVQCTEERKRYRSWTREVMRSLH